MPPLMYTHRVYLSRAGCQGGLRNPAGSIYHSSKPPSTFERAATAGGSNIDWGGELSERDVGEGWEPRLPWRGQGGGLVAAPGCAHRAAIAR